MNGVTRRATFGAAISVAVGALAGCTSPGSASGSKQLTVGSASMEPTLMQGQAVTVDPVTAGKYQPRRQDIVFFHPPASWHGFDTTQVFVSRVIGIPGDTVYCNGAGLPVVLNGVPLKEPYLYHGDAPSTFNFRAKVPSGRLFLLDDHRSIAVDCRYQLSDPDNSGYVPIGNVLGIYQA